VNDVRNCFTHAHYLIILLKDAILTTRFDLTITLMKVFWRCFAALDFCSVSSSQAS
jgi:hypothetical protein